MITTLFKKSARRTKNFFLRSRVDLWWIDLNDLTVTEFPCYLPKGRLPHFCVKLFSNKKNKSMNLRLVFYNLSLEIVFFSTFKP